MRAHRRIWISGAVAAASVAGVLVFQGVTGSDQGDGKPDAKSGPVETDVNRAALKVADNGRTAALPRRDTEPYSMLGVTWTDPAAKVAGKVEVRTRSAKTGQWSDWLDLDTEIDSRMEGESGGVRGATEPRWVGPSNGVEVRLDGTSTGGKLPAGLRLDMIDPGKGATSGTADVEPAAFVAEPAEPDATEESSNSPEPGATDTGAPAEPGDPTTASPSQDPAPTSSAPTTPPASTSPTASAPSSSSPTASPSPSTSIPTAPPSTAPRPPITSRAGWGADEKMSPDPSDYLTDIKAVFVHHTAQTSDYACTDSPEIVRSLYAYHVKSQGWNDIGYNFVVDKCGTIFEGRKGGVDLPVFGAHTYGFNRESTGIAVIGTYTDAAAATVATQSVARVAAWKLGQYKADPAGTVNLLAGATGNNFFGKKFTAGTVYPFQRISGHRDGFNTQCPGDKLYAQLPAIRSYAAGPVAGLAIKSVTGAGLSGSTYYTTGDVTVGWSATTPSAFVSKYELLVDGKVAATATGTATSAKATLAVGTHKVQVRATHISGKTSVSATATVVADKTAPTFTTKPSLALKTGTVNTTAVPLTLSWKATDTAALKEVKLTAPVAKTYGPTTTSASHTAKSAAATTWSMTAYDQAGNKGTASVAGTPTILQETSATKSGTWTTKSSSSYLGGKSYSSSSKNASLTWTFTGRSAAWVVSRASSSGQAYVYVDGTKVATVDLKSTTTKYRDAIWTKTWSSSAKHTVKIVVVGTSGRPTVTTDGLVYLK
ncbi:peptidoglycan recognition protein [Streptomyces sp. NPDC091292]|uniref:peptidoglycan recognition protein family protein n=1 Tax=Streptomyces sp. NPDC091292 TaxID=3365991 RepID=UPI0038266405